MAGKSPSKPFYTHLVLTIPTMTLTTKLQSLLLIFAHSVQPWRVSHLSLSLKYTHVLFICLEGCLLACLCYESGWGGSERGTRAKAKTPINTLITVWQEQPVPVKDTLGHWWDPGANSRNYVEPFESQNRSWFGIDVLGKGITTWHWVEGVKDIPEDTTQTELIIDRNTQNKQK